MGLAAGLAEVRPAVASVAELEPSRERGVWAEALAMLVANTAARMRNFFINQRRKVAERIALAYGIRALTVNLKCDFT
jgi:hypothetical protein